MGKPCYGAVRLLNELAAREDSWSLDRLCTAMVAGGYRASANVRSVRRFLEGGSGRNGKIPAQVRRDLTAFLKAELNLDLSPTYFDPKQSWMERTGKFITTQDKYSKVAQDFVGDFTLHMLQASQVVNPPDDAEFRSQRLSITNDGNGTFGFTITHWQGDQPSYSGYVVGSRDCLQLVGFPDKKDSIIYLWLGIDPREVGLADVKLFGFAAGAVSNKKAPMARGAARRVVVTAPDVETKSLSSATLHWLLGRGARPGTNAGMLVELEHVDEEE